MNELFRALSIRTQRKLFTRTPGCYSAAELRSYSVEEEYEPDKWRPARQCGYTIEFMVRVRLAWAVFTGKYDALHWGDKSGEWSNKHVKYKDCINVREAKKGQL